jgi:hypothetical protein
MLEITYTLLLGQFLKITPHLKIIYVVEIKAKKHNIATKQVSKPNVAVVLGHILN